MKENKGNLYKLLYDVYRKAHPEKNEKAIQTETNILWAELRESGNESGNFAILVEKRISSLKRLATCKKANSSLLNYLTSKNNNKQNSNLVAVSESHSVDLNTNNVAISDMRAKVSEKPLNETEDENSIGSRITKKPAQELLIQNIQELEKKISAITEARDSGLSNDENIGKLLKELRSTLTSKKNELRIKKQDSRRQKKRREAKKLFILDVCEKHPEYLKKFNIRQKAGKPRLEEDQEHLLKVIADLAIFGGAVDDRRRTEVIRSCKTLDELCDELKKLGFQISRSAIYLRLLPRYSKSIEGKRHVKTVPVKLCRSLADLHRQHPDADFCRASIRDLEVLASILGLNQVCFLSQDDKARVPIGITAAHKQAPMLMHLEYKVTLPDHDWVIAEKHKLIPSVYAGIVIDPEKNGEHTAVSYSGPTYVAIRSGKHSSSTAESHSKDLRRLLDLPAFDPIMKTSDGFIKPIMICTVDGGPDENPRYRKVIDNAIKNFKDFNLDALYIATNAPGRSAYNRVERRMAPLSKELSGLILPHDYFGSHLDEKKQTVNIDLEHKNFQYAGNVLSEVWSSMVIDNHTVIAEYINPENLVAAKSVDMKWYQQHVREGQYLLQIVKCDNLECCSQRRSNLWDVLPSGFLLQPYPILQDSSLRVPDPEEEFSGTFSPLLMRLALDKQLISRHCDQRPYDAYCPSIKTKISSRCCSECGLYHASIKSAANHKKEVHNANNVSTTRIRPERVAARRAKELLCIIKSNDKGDEDAEWLEEDDVDCTFEEEEDVDENIPVITSVKNWTSSPWVTED